MLIVSTYKNKQTDKKQTNKETKGRLLTKQNQNLAPNYLTFLFFSQWSGEKEKLIKQTPIGNFTTKC